MPPTDTPAPDMYPDLRTYDDWHEDYGSVLWTRTPIEEPPYCGTPLDSDWPWSECARPVDLRWTPLPACFHAPKVTQPTPAPTPRRAHSAGPWVWRDWGAGWLLIQDAGRRPAVLTAIGGRAHVVRQKLGVRDETGLLVPLTPDHPDAKLIASAPALLEALEECARIIALDSLPNHQPRVGLREKGRALAQASAAIAAATGGEGE